MAQELQIRDGGERVKLRSPWAAALLPIITLGVYGLVWWYKINRELRDFGRARGRDLGQSPTNSLLAMFPGALIVVPPFVSYWRGTKRVQAAARLAGREPLNGWIALLLLVVVSVGYNAYVQSELNKVWRTEALPLAGEAPPPPLDDGMPPPLPAEERSAAPAADPEADRPPLQDS